MSSLSTPRKVGVIGVKRPTTATKKADSPRSSALKKPVIGKDKGVKKPSPRAEPNNTKVIPAKKPINTSKEAVKAKAD